MPEYSALSSFLAGIFAGASGVLVGHPFDTLKVKYQVGRTISLVEGSRSQFYELYRGVLPPLLTSGAISSLTFSMYEYFKSRLREDLSFSHLSAVFVSGTISGAIISIVTSPISCVKLQQQLSTTKGIIPTIYHMKQSHGVLSFYRGYSPFFIMESFGRGVYLHNYEFSKSFLKRRVWPQIFPMKEMKHDTNDSLTIRMISAAYAGCSSWLAVYPFDVIKSRLQLDIKREKYRSIQGCIRHIYMEHGISGFFRGLSFTMIRAAPVAATVLPVYEFAAEKIDGILIQSSSSMG